MAGGDVVCRARRSPRLRHDAGEDPGAAAEVGHGAGREPAGDELAGERLGRVERQVAEAVVMDRGLRLTVEAVIVHRLDSPTA